MKINQADTAIEHFHNVVEPTTRHFQASTIMDALKDDGDYTIGEIAQKLGMEKSTVSARRHELLKIGWLVKGGKRQCRISGVTCETVRINRVKES